MLRWTIILIGLAVVEAVAAVLMFVILRHAGDVHDAAQLAAARRNEIAERLDALDRLSAHAQLVATVADLGDERQDPTALRAAFVAEVHAVERLLLEDPRPVEYAHILAGFDALLLQLEALIPNAMNGSSSPAPRVQQEIHRLDTGLTDLRAAIRTVQHEALAQALDRAAALQRAFFGIDLLTLLLVLITLVFASRAMLRMHRYDRTLRAQTAALERSDRRNAAVIAGAPDGIAVLDEAGTVIELNPAAERLLGRTRDQAIGRRGIEVLPISDGDEPLALPEGGRHETVVLRSDGTPVDVVMAVALVDDGERRIRLVHLHDIRERKRAKAELLESNRDLAAFASVASHDLQAPLRVIQSYLDLLERRCQHLDDRSREYIARIVDAAERMRALIMDLLAYARIERAPMDTGPVDLDEVLDRALEILAEHIRAADAVIDRSPLPTVQGVRSQLIQLLQNLVGNAVKYRGDAPPRIRITATHDDDRWCVSVRDNGIGIHPADHDRIFGLFERVHGRADYEGTGIGLAICRKIVERHGGRIWVESSPGLGSDFRFTLRAG